MIRGRRTGILGGTFDPIHLGHLAAAAAASDALALDEVLFITSSLPPHRDAQPRASAFHRFAMVSLAVDPHPGFVASDVELLRDGPSYTAETLRTLHAEGHPASQLFFITGTDAFAEIATWHGYPEVLDLAHFVVISRPGRSFDDLRSRLTPLLPRMREVGASEAAAGDDRPAIHLVRAHTPEASSTEVRARAAAAKSLAGLVPPEVERHIVRHRLYASG